MYMNIYIYMCIYVHVCMSMHIHIYYSESYICIETFTSFILFLFYCSQNIKSDAADDNLNQEADGEAADGEAMDGDTDGETDRDTDTDFEYEFLNFLSGIRADCQYDRYFKFASDRGRGSPWDGSIM